MQDTQPQHFLEFEKINLQKLKTWAFSGKIKKTETMSQTALNIFNDNATNIARAAAIEQSAKVDGIQLDPMSRETDKYVTRCTGKDCELSEGFRILSEISHPTFEGTPVADRWLFSIDQDVITALDHSPLAKDLQVLRPLIFTHDKRRITIQHDRDPELYAKLAAKIHIRRPKNNDPLIIARVKPHGPNIYARVENTNGIPLVSFEMPEERDGSFKDLLHKEINERFEDHTYLHKMAKGLKMALARPDIQEAGGEITRNKPVDVDWLIKLNSECSDSALSESVTYGLMYGIELTKDGRKELGDFVKSFHFAMIDMSDPYKQTLLTELKTVLPVTEEARFFQMRKDGYGGWNISSLDEQLNVLGGIDGVHLKPRENEAAEDEYQKFIDVRDDPDGVTIRRKAMPKNHARWMMANYLKKYDKRENDLAEQASKSLDSAKASEIADKRIENAVEVSKNVVLFHGFSDGNLRAVVLLLDRHLSDQDLNITILDNPGILAGGSRKEACEAVKKGLIPKIARRGSPALSQAGETHQGAAMSSIGPTYAHAAAQVSQLGSAATDLSDPYDATPRVSAAQPQSPVPGDMTLLDVPMQETTAASQATGKQPEAPLSDRLRVVSPSQGTQGTLRRATTTLTPLATNSPRGTTDPQQQVGALPPQAAQSSSKKQKVLNAARNYPKKAMDKIKSLKNVFGRP